MGIKLSCIKEYLNLKPVEEITKISGSNEEYQTEVFSCLSFIKDFKDVENKLFTEIEENSFDNKFTDYYHKYDRLLKDSMIDIPEVSTETIKKHFKYFNSSYENFDSLYKLLVISDAIFCLAQEWLECNEKDKPNGPEEWVEIQEDIYHFAKRETVKRVIEKFNECKPIINKSKEYKKFEKYFPTEYQNRIHFLKEIFNQNQSPKKIAMMTCLLTQNNIISIDAKKGGANFFRSWYDFIKLEHPKNDNFEGINKYIPDRAVNGFVFKDELDVDYLKLKLKLENEFLST